jgi:ATP-dependent DNA ligase
VATVYYAFDVLALGREPLPSESLDARRQRLKPLGLVSIRRFDRIVKDGRGAFTHMQVLLAENM